MRRLKLTLGILMIAALFVPLSECSRGGKTATTPAPPRTLLQKTFPRSDNQTEYKYGITSLGFSLHGVLTLLAFGWPLVLALLARRVGGTRHAWLFHLLELLLCAGTLWWIYAVTEGGRRLWGAYFAFALAALYASATLVELLPRRPDRISNRAPGDKAN